MRLYKYPLFHHNFSIYQWLLPLTIFTMMFTWRLFSMSLIPSMFISWNSTIWRVLSILSYLFIYSFIWLFFMLVWTHVYLLYSVDYIHNYIYFVTQIVPLWSLRILWHWLLCTFTMFPTFCGHFLTYWHKMFQVYVIFAVKNWMNDIVLLRNKKTDFCSQSPWPLQALISYSSFCKLLFSLILQKVASIRECWMVLDNCQMTDIENWYLRKAV